jgi:hypothetical protein
MPPAVRGRLIGMDFFSFSNLAKAIDPGTRQARDGRELAVGVGVLGLMSVGEVDLAHDPVLVLDRISGLTGWGRNDCPAVHHPVHPGILSLLPSSPGFRFVRVARVAAALYDGRRQARRQRQRSTSRNASSGVWNCSPRCKRTISPRRNGRNAPGMASIASSLLGCPTSRPMHARKDTA